MLVSSADILIIIFVEQGIMLVGSVSLGCGEDFVEQGIKCWLALQTF